MQGLIQVCTCLLFKVGKCPDIDGFYPDSCCCLKPDLLLSINIEQAQFLEVCLNSSVHIPKIPAGTHAPVFLCAKTSPYLCQWDFFMYVQVVS